MTRAWAAAMLCSAGLHAADVFGTVVDKATGKPVGEARVVATVSRGVDQPADILVLLTAEDGRFRFTGMPDSGCRLRAEKDGYFFRLDDYPRAGGPLTLDLERPPVSKNVPVVVHVVDDTGYPIAAASVRFEPPIAGGSTGKDGALRTAAPPGRYRVVTDYPGYGTWLRLRNQTFPPTYYPGTTDANRAGWVEVAPGKETDVTLRVTPITAREIRGRLGFSGSLIQIFVLPQGSKDYGGIWGLPQEDGDSGEFRIFGLAPGNYALDVMICETIPCMSATPFRRTVTVSDGDIRDLVILESDRAQR